MPFYPDEGQEDRDRYNIFTFDDYLVAKWANMPIIEVGKLNIIDYLQYRRDSFIYSARQTEKGAEYLKNAWYLEQTEPDRERLRAEFGKE